MGNRDYNKDKIFIERTLTVINQYEEYKMYFEKSYTHTLFINACVGLLMVPADSIIGELPLYDIDENNWGISPTVIIEIKGGEGKSVRNIARKLRNAIAHNNFHFECNDDPSTPIENLHIENQNREFIAEIPFSALKKFVLKLAEESLKILHRKIGHTS